MKKRFLTEKQRQRKAVEWLKKYYSKKELLSEDILSLIKPYFEATKDFHSIHSIFDIFNTIRG